MKEKVNAVILAGTKNCEPFIIGKQTEYKQYLELEKKPILSYVIDATLCAKRVDKIFIIAEPRRITPLLRIYKGKARERIHLIENQESLMQSMLYCFKEWTPKGILLPSDAPFLQAKDIDHFINSVEQNIDYTMGFTDGRKIDALFNRLSLYVKKEKIKYGLFPIHNAQIRISNLHYIDFTKLTATELDLVQAVFDHRKLLKEDGRKDRRNWRKIAGGCFRYLHKRKYHPAIIIGSLLAIGYGILFYCAHKTKGTKLEKVYTFFLRPSFIATIITMLTGWRIKCQIMVNEDLSPMLDIDVPEAYLLFAKNKHFEEVKHVLREF